ncbi:MAG: rhomboid family intramembrane serine protease [Flavobacteriales bacterium]
MTFFEQQKLQFQQANIAVKLIYINVILFILTLLIESFINLNESHFSILDWFVLKNDTSWVYKPWTLISYAFFHSPKDLFHLLSNMIFLYFFGTFFLYYFSKKMFLRVYFLGALFGGLFFILLTNLFPVFNYSTYSLIGASASIYAIIAVIIVYDPNKEIRLFGLISLKLWQLAGFILIMDLLQIAGGKNIGGHLSHFGGALAGYLYLKQFNKGDPLGQFIESVSNLLKRKKTFKTTKNSTPPRDDYDFNAEKKENQEKIDGILDKISKSGYESLTKEEKAFLFKQGK